MPADEDNDYNNALARRGGNCPYYRPTPVFDHVFLLLTSFSTHSTCGVLCTVLFCLAGYARLPQHFSVCYCTILEVI